MKKILCFILALLMLVSVVSCGTTPKGSEETTDSVAVSDTDTPTTKGEDKKEAYTGPFKAGFGRVDITPTELPITLNTGDPLTKVLDPLYVTCVAVSDGKNTALIITADVKNMGDAFCNTVRTRISRSTGVPEENIMMSATHDHSAPNPNTSSTADTRLIKWTAKLYNQFIDAAKEAVKDLSDATIKVGTAKTTGMAFVRRYIHEDGTFSSIHYRQASKTPKVAYETEADDNLQMMRLVREDKKDIMLLNWQAHVAHAIGDHRDSITADLVGHVRTDVETGDDDLLVAYYQGASGNINLTVAVKGSGKYGGSYKLVGKGIAKLVLQNKDKLKEVSAGKIKADKWTYAAEYRIVDDADLIARAQAIVDAGIADREGNEYKALLDKYKMQSWREVERVVSYSKPSRVGKTDDFTLGAISFGDIAFASVPYEMFDTNGMEVKNGSPAEMTFMLTCAGGAFAYIPAANAVPNGGYEVYTSAYKYGTAEEVVAEILAKLNKQYK